MAALGTGSHHGDRQDQNGDEEGDEGERDSPTVPLPLALRRHRHLPTALPLDVTRAVRDAAPGLAVDWMALGQCRLDGLSETRELFAVVAAGPKP